MFRVDLDDLGLDQLAGTISLIQILPRVGLQRLQTQANAAAVAVDTDDFDLHTLAFPDHFAGVFHALIGQL